MLEYLEAHGMSRVAKRLVASGAIDTLATAAPGIKDILVLGKVKQLERRADADLILLDAPAAGHAITFLRSARGLLDAVRVGPIHNQAAEVMELLTDPERCQVVLVTLAEETPVNELVETAYNLEDQVGVALGPVVVNGVYPDRPGLAVDPEAAAADAGATLRDGEVATLRAAAEFRRDRVALQAEQIERLQAQLPLPQLRLPFLFGAELGPAELDQMAARLRDQLAARPGVP
jgi:anion-transporting  ArsA/GET3 family ATPase